MKTFVVHGTFLQMKITPIIRPKKNTFNIRTIGRSLSIKSGNDTQPLRKRSSFKHALSTLKRLHQEAGGDQLEPILLLEIQTMETQHRVLPLPGGNGKNPGSLPKNLQKVKKRRGKQKACDLSEQPVVHRTLAKTSDEWLSRIHFILLQLDRLQLTAVYCTQREV